MEIPSTWIYILHGGAHIENIEELGVVLNFWGGGQLNSSGGKGTVQLGHRASSTRNLNGSELPTPPKKYRNQSYLYHTHLIQTALLVSSSVILGYLTEHLALTSPSEEDTRNAYLLAFGKRQHYSVQYSCISFGYKGIYLVAVSFRYK